MVGGKDHQIKNKKMALLAKFWPNSAVCSSECVRFGQRSHL